MPQTLVVFLVGTLSLAGIPLFAGFFSKEEILGAVWTGGLAVPFVMLVLAAFLTAFYMFRVVFIAFFGAPAHAAAGHGDAGHHAHDAPAVMTIPLWILAALAVALGVGFAVAHPAPEFEAPAWLTPLAVGVAVAGIVLAWLTYQRHIVNAATLSGAFGAIRDAATQRFWLDDVFTLIYREVVLGVARVVGWIDRYLVDGIVNVLSAWTLRSATGCGGCSRACRRTTCTASPSACSSSSSGAICDERQAAEKGPSASLAPSAAMPRRARVTWTDDRRLRGPRNGPRTPPGEYASRAAFGRRLAAGPF